MTTNNSNSKEENTSNPLKSLIITEMGDCIKDNGWKWAVINHKFVHIPPRPFQNSKAKKLNKKGLVPRGFSYTLRGDLELIAAQHSNLGILARAILNLEPREANK